METICHYQFPIGILAVSEDGAGITGIRLVRQVKDFVRCIQETELTKLAAEQLREYFQGSRVSFTLPLSLHGTEFQIRVWYALQAIPYGETRSYAQIAAQVGSPKAFRAVGMANHCNPVMIAIPCHRVIGADRRLVGYAGGLEVKARLLSLESGQLNVDFYMESGYNDGNKENAKKGMIGTT